MSAPSHLGQQEPGAAQRTGLTAGVISYILWGLFPIYMMQVREAWALEILVHRILWAVPFAALLIFIRKQWPEIKKAFANPRVMITLAATATIISLNWLVYTWAATHERISEASLGYFINPIMYVAVGIIILKEPLRRLQMIAILIACVGVLVMAVVGGDFPLIAIFLAISFTAYGYLRKTVDVGALPGLFIEVLFLSPFAFICLWWMGVNGVAQFNTEGSELNALLIVAGPITVAPLVLFALAARRLRLTTLGLLHYIGPTLQFMLSRYYGERLSLSDGVCFVLIWIAITIFAYDSLRADKISKAASAHPVSISNVVK